MSRKWERMVIKNQKQLKKTRKTGTSGVLSGKPGDQAVTYKGRSWLFPLFLICFSIFYFIVYWDAYPERDGIFWFTGIGYFLLGLLMYWLRRPMLTIRRQSLTSRRFAGDKTLEAKEIEQIVISPAFLTIQLKGKRIAWQYSKFQHRFPLHEVREHLIEFAKRNQIPLKELD